MLHTPPSIPNSHVRLNSFIKVLEALMKSPEQETRRVIGSSTDVSRPAIPTGGSNASSTDVPQPAAFQNTLQTFIPNSRLNDPISARRRSCVSEWILLNWTKKVLRRRVAARGRKMVARTKLTLRWNIRRRAKQVTRIHGLILILHLLCLFSFTAFIVCLLTSPAWVL
jgi:hypothetical protein